MKKMVAIVGGGASGLLLGLFLDHLKFNVHIYEQKKTLGRKFLVAGKGGFNLTHGSGIEEMIQEYEPPSFIRPFLTAFSNLDLRAFLASLGINTFVGSSGRVFPEDSIKPFEVLEAIKVKLVDRGVKIHTSSKWLGFDDGNLLIDVQGSVIKVDPDIVIFGLGGKSWIKTGSDGLWKDHFLQRGIKVLPFQPSNCGIKINWPEEFLKKWEGKPIKNIAVSIRDDCRVGELLITKYGLEGGAVYALSRQVRKTLDEGRKPILYIDLKPDISDPQKIILKKSLKSDKSVTYILKKELRLEKVKLAMIKSIIDKKTFTDRGNLENFVHQLPLEIESLVDLDQAISTVGGVALNEVTEHLELKKLANHYVMGEMLDWDAPTGGYLLQACFSMAHWIASHLNRKG
jgi:uncharacterized flavoprotein (TIGR03862 family)